MKIDPEIYRMLREVTRALNEVEAPYAIEAPLRWHCMVPHGQR